LPASRFRKPSSASAADVVVCFVGFSALVKRYVKEIVSADNDLNAAVQAECLAVENPNLHP
jgi:hypothetical protein